MDTKKLDKWADLLLDTGKRNNLIHFRDTKMSSAEVLFPSSEELFKKTESSVSFEVFEPKTSEKEEDAEDIIRTDYPQLEAIASTDSRDDEKAAFLAKYSGQIRRQGQILLYNPHSNPLSALKNIQKKTQSVMEETGVNIAYMVFGFFHWKEYDSSDVVYRAPILLVPIRIERLSYTDPYIITPNEDEIIVNQTFAFKLDSEYGIKLPSYNDEGLSNYLQTVKQIVSNLKWDVSDECKIGMFSFLKINMYKDLKDNSSRILSNRNVRLIMGESIDANHMGLGDGGSSQMKNPLVELHSVVDADSSQIEAIEMAKSGRSFVLQGPPGTGKSQTITNIIAECLADGKKVLFVSEKLAALNVVYDKLKQADLAEFCLEIHSHKSNKKGVIAEINNTLHAEKHVVSKKADMEIESKKKAQNKLDTYAYELHKQHPIIEKSLFGMYEAYAEVGAMPDVGWIVPQLSSKGDAYLKETVPLLEQYTEYIPSIGYDYRKNPWYGYINQDLSYQARAEVERDLSAAGEFLKLLCPLLKEITEKYGVKCENVEDARFWTAFFSFAASSAFITPSLLERSQFERADSALQEMQVLCSEILAIRSALCEVFDESFFELAGADYHQKLTKEYEGKFSRLFNAEYNRIIKELQLNRKNGKKPSYDEAVEATEQLSLLQQKNAAFFAAENSIRPLLGGEYKGLDTDWNSVNGQLSALREFLSDGRSFGALEWLPDFSGDRKGFADYAQKLNHVFASCDDRLLERLADRFDREVWKFRTDSCSVLSEKIFCCLREKEQLNNWCLFRNLLSELKDKQVLSYIHEAIRLNVEQKNIVGSFLKLFYGQWIESVLSATPGLYDLDRIAHDNACKVFVEKDRQQFSINKAIIRAELSSMRPSLDGVIASGSGLSNLLREGEKKRRQKSIRTLLTENGALIQRIKPCFLMSPLSVSTFLSPDSVHFDVVIFDEASQIFPQDAIGAIYRGDQLIVVGDSRQMPPSNFFNAMIESGEYDSEEEEKTDVDPTDYESILDLCSASMPQLRLRWHYRSRFEQLIAFSNVNYYNGSLITFPSAKTDAPGIGVDYYHVDGVFDRKSHSNRKEAEFVVDLIYRNIEQFPDRSLGVVAFSIAQQDLIDKLLSRRRMLTPEKEFFFKRNGKEPFFVKNLETVQGDERDTIIFSVAYGVDAQGRLRHFFGPLNLTGGERRLNVAVTRAKFNVQVVSSMHYTDIDLSHTAAEGARLLREYLDFAENGPIALERTLSFNQNEQVDSDFEAEVCDFLREKGFSVVPQVGCSGFRIDLGLKRPDSSDFVLAIECDGAAYHSSKNARDRDRLRQEILERMGWKFYRIWSTDWFRNKSEEKLRLLQAAAEAVSNPTKEKSDPEETANPESFEESAPEAPFTFPVYKEADVYGIYRRHGDKGFQEFVKEVLDVEAPLSEELFLQRIVGLFGREKVTSIVRSAYIEKMYGCRRLGIIRRNGFLYLDEEKKLQLRVPGDLKRKITQIAPEELAAGMVEIIRQNISIDKDSLYHTLAVRCGDSRVGPAIRTAMDGALRSLEEWLVTDGNQISLKNP